MIWGELFREATARLAKAGLDNPDMSARRIVEEAAGAEPSEFTTALNEAVTEGGIARFDAMMQRRIDGEPLQYVVGRWGFRTLDLAVDSRVLIPRPETEFMVDVALGQIDRRAAEDPERPVLVADLGTGSGAIALSIATERTGTEVWATDVSPEALSVARANLAGLGRAAARVRLLEGTWFEAFPRDIDPSERVRFDVIVSNPPYVRGDDPLPVEVEMWEPAQALRSGPEGLDDIASIISGAADWLHPMGALVLEADPRQMAAIRTLLGSAGFVSITVDRDLAGRDRVISAVYGPNVEG